MSEAAPLRRGRRRAVFAVVVGAVLMHAVDQTAVATALDAMRDDLGTTVAWISWTITVYGLGQIVVLPLAGALGDRFGTRRVFLAGIGCFVLASVACAASADVAMLVGARLVQGTAGAVLLPSATAVVAAEFGPDRDRAVTLFSTVVNVLFGATAIGFSALVPQYAQVRYGLDALAAGGVLTTRSVLMIAASTVAVALLRRWGSRRLLVVGLAVCVAALALTASPPVAGTAVVWLAGASGVLGLGLGLTAPASSNAGLALVPGRAATVSGLQVMFRQIGSILAVSVVTAVASTAADPGAATAVAFAVLAALLAVALLAALRLPDQRGRW